MPIFVDEDLRDDPLRVKTETIGEEITHKDVNVLGTTIITEKNQSQDIVRQYLSGYPWKVDYYNNLSGINDIVNPVSDRVDNGIQKYNKYKNLILYLSSGMSPGDFENLNGDAVINAGIVPRINDHFISRLIDGRIGIFVVKTVKTLTYQAHDVFSIEFAFYQMHETDKTILESLENKTILRYVYDKDYILTRGSPMVLEEQLKQKLELKESKDRIVKQYLNRFTDHQTKFLNPRGNDVKLTRFPLLVDSFLNHFLRRIISIGEYDNYNKFRDFDYYPNSNISKTIWDVLLERDEDFLFSSQYGLQWIGVKHSFAYPSSRNLDYLGAYGVVDLPHSPREVLAISTSELFNRPEVNEEINYPLTLNEEKLNYYVFSSHFYNEEYDKTTDFENLVMRYIRKEKIEPSELYVYINQWRRWSLYEQFYILPVLILLIEDSRKYTYREQ